ncbi:MAG: DHA2 family efflux MFS transporter permease subunit [Steroidobacteraceae bacterium]
MTRNDVTLSIGVLCIAPFMSVLDLTLVNIILPHIAGGYGATPSEATLVVTFFAVAQAIAMPLTGALAQRFGVVRTYLYCLAGFALASLLCGAAPSLAALIAARVLQGFAAGPVVPLAQAILQRTLPPRHLAKGLAIFGTAMMSGPLIGPALGGLLADSIGWRWGFFVNLPLAALCLALSARLFRHQDSVPVRRPIDAVGLALMVTWVAATQVVLDKGRELEWFDSPLIVALTIVALLGFVAFLIWELTERHPIVDLSVFRHRGFSVAATATAVSYAIATAGSIMVYLWLQTGLHYDATTAGYVAAATGSPGLLVGPLLAWLSTRLDPRLLASFGLLMTAIAFMSRTQFVHDVDFFHILMPQFAIGIAAVFFWGPLMNLAMQHVPAEDVSAAAGLLTFTRTLALGVTVAVLMTLWDHQEKAEHARLAAAITNPQAVGGPLGSFGMTAEQSNTALNLLVDQQSAVLSLRHMFWVLSGVLLASLVAIWFAPVKERGGARA